MICIFPKKSTIIIKVSVWKVFIFCCVGLCIEITLVAGGMLSSNSIMRALNFPLKGGGGKLGCSYLHYLHIGFSKPSVAPFAGKYVCTLFVTLNFKYEYRYLYIVFIFAASKNNYYGFCMAWNHQIYEGADIE